MDVDKQANHAGAILSSTDSFNFNSVVTSSSNTWSYSFVGNLYIVILFRQTEPHLFKDKFHFSPFSINPNVSTLTLVIE